MRRLLAPEVVQTSAMDCGPAALKCLLEGFGVRASYGRLREACQTDVDGTSIDTLEDVAVRLGLEAEQIMVPPDHVLLEEAGALPALVVVRLPNGFTHFVVVWRTLGSIVQVMDPGSGRRWIPRARLLEQLYVHESRVPVADFGEWAASADFTAPLMRRMRGLGCDRDSCARMLAAAREGGWRALARLDAAVRMVGSLVHGSGVRVGAEARRVLAACIEERDAIPDAFFSARAADEGEVVLRGAVLLRASGVRPPALDELREASPELARALEEPPARPGRALLALVRDAGALGPAALFIGLAFAAVGILVEASLLRAVLELGRDLTIVKQRAIAFGLLIALAVIVRGLHVCTGANALRLGRQVETRLRLAFLGKLPRLGDRYFQSRPISDMAERAHAVQEVRALPDAAARLTRAAMELVTTAAAIAWVDRPSALLALAACGVALLVPFAWQPTLVERDLRVRSHGGALARWCLDALLGLVPLRTHGAETAVRREHEALLAEWARASRALVRASAWAEAVQILLASGAVAWMVVRFVEHASDTSGVLLIAYWGLYMPALGEEIATILRQYPGQRNVTLRLLEPLGAAEEPRSTADAGSPASEPSNGVAIEMRGVGVVASGHVVLEGVHLRIAPGEHVAIVGASGAGKSTLVGLLLGWYRASSGELLVDGRSLEVTHLAALRARTAWVDPAVRLWNRSLLDNLHYGAEPRAAGAIARVLESAEVQPLLDRLPEGLQTPLGEGGALVSGGEGQRVRLGRAMMRPSARLTVLDEPFRGLDRSRRRELLLRARAWWSDATLLCITHDVAETRAFGRVLVVHGGRVVEDGPPDTLASDPSSHYRAMLDAEHALSAALWGGPQWRRMRMDKGVLSEERDGTRAAPEGR